MSLKNPKNLVIIGAAVVALVAATVLVGGYVNVSSGESPTCSGLKACPATAQIASSPAQNSPEESDKGCCPAQGCQEECDKPCCTEEAKSSCGGEAKSCCDEEAKS